MLALAAAFIFAACARRGPPPVPTPQPTVALHNPLNFPLYPRSRLLIVNNFSITSREENLVATEVVAASNASFQQIRSWLARLYQYPPPGYAIQNSDFGKVNMPDGIVFGAFQSKRSLKPRTVLVIVLNPPVVNRTLGPALKLLAMYRHLPAGWRSGIDERFRKQAGFSISEATAPDKPLGIALAAMETLQQRQDRAILLVSTQKR